MSPLYVLCPHCDFPAVVRGYDREVPRYCRQCRGLFIPDDAVCAHARRGNGKEQRVRDGRRRRALAMRGLARRQPS